MRGAGGSSTASEAGKGAIPLPDDNPKPDASLRTSLRALAAISRLAIQASPGRTVARAIVRLLGDFTGPLGAIGLKMLADGVIKSDARTTIRGAVIVGVTHVGADGLGWLGMALYFSMNERIGRMLDRRLMRLAVDIPGIEHYERADYQDELQLLRDQRWQLADLPDSAMMVAGMVVRSVVTLGLLATVHPLLLVLPLFGVPSVLIGSRAEKRRLSAQESVVQRRRLLQELFDVATEPQPAKELRIFGLGAEILRRHRTEWDSLDREQNAVEVGNARARTLGWLVFGAGFLAAIVFVVLRAAAGSATPGDVVLTLSLAGQVNMYLSNLVGNIGWFLDTLQAGRRYVWLADYAENAARPGSVRPPNRIDRGIDLRGVAFRYPGTDVEALSDVNLHLPAGSTVAIVGENGAGKTTLVKLLCRFYEPSAGSILVDGVPLADIDPSDWRERMSAGFQDFAKFELLAGDTVGVGNLPFLGNDGAVMEALHRASASDVVEDLPEGLVTQLGKSYTDGAELSAGQWQKLALGRAMMRDTPLLLVLDEPTSSLDAPTEHALFERYAGAARRAAVANGAITVLVSHRFSTVRMADLIVVVKRGGLAEVGTHAQLVARGGLYAELYELQARAYR